MLELKNVKKSYDGTVVLKDISLDIEEGEIVSILGPSGCGKTDVYKRQLLYLTVVIDDLSQETDRSAKEESLEHIEPHIMAWRFLFYIVFILFLLFHALHFIHDEYLLFECLRIFSGILFIERCSD